MRVSGSRKVLKCILNLCISLCIPSLVCFKLYAHDPSVESTNSCEAAVTPTDTTTSRLAIADLRGMLLAKQIIPTEIERRGIFTTVEGRVREDMSKLILPVAASEKRQTWLELSEDRLGVAEFVQLELLIEEDQSTGQSRFREIVAQKLPETIVEQKVPYTVHEQDNADLVGVFAGGVCEVILNTIYCVKELISSGSLPSPEAIIKPNLAFAVPSLILGYLAFRSQRPKYTTHYTLNHKAIVEIFSDLGRVGLTESQFAKILVDTFLKENRFFNLLRLTDETEFKKLIRDFKSVLNTVGPTNENFAALLYLLIKSLDRSISLPRNNRSFDSVLIDAFFGNEEGNGAFLLDVEALNLAIDLILSNQRMPLAWGLDAGKIFEAYLRLDSDMNPSNLPPAQ